MYKAECDQCKEPIATNDVIYEVVVGGFLSTMYRLTFHAKCIAAWGHSLVQSKCGVKKE